MKKSPQEEKAGVYLEHMGKHELEKRYYENLNKPRLNLQKPKQVNLRLIQGQSVISDGLCRTLIVLMAIEVTVLLIGSAAWMLR